jgi:DNA-binding MarR family transcriptional regulator
MTDITRQTELRDAIELLFFGYRAFTAPPDRILEQRGLGRVHHRILYFVGRSPGLSVNALLTTLRITKQALNAPLRQLVEMRLVSVERSKEDGRVREIALTASGRALEAQLSGTQLKRLAAVFERAGSDAEAGWRTVMQALAHVDD